MKKILPFIIVAVVILIVVLLWPTGEFKTYKNSRYNFSVVYPASWTLGEAPTNNDGRTFINPDSGVECRAYGFANALQNEKGEPQSLEDFVDWLTADTRVGEGLYTNVIERKKTTLDGQNAIYLLMEQDMDLVEAVYVLGSEEGRGLVCYYNDKDEWGKYNDVFQTMKKSFTLKTKPISVVNTNECSTLLSGVITPFKDFQTFRDTKYTEVTITSREFWDKNKLPKQVIDLENKDYTCYPMPAEFEGGELEGGVMAEPVVTEVEWSCELEYNDWQYLEGNDTSGKQVAEKAGFTCEKQNCFTDGHMINEAIVLLCTK